MSIKGTDVATIIGKGLVGAIPFVGPLVAEIVGATIPNQRIDRIALTLRLLERKIEEKDKAKVEERITSPESIDLIEDGFLQASRALSDERKEYIASLLKNGLTDDDLERFEYKKLLAILGELNDVELVHLKSHIMRRGQPDHEEFWEKHQETLKAPLVYMQSPQEDIDRNAIFQTYKTHLVGLGLLKPRFKKPRKGESPEFDEKTGMLKAQGYDITSLGRLLLRSIDQGGEL